MKRRGGSDLVPNEKRVLMAVAYLTLEEGQTRFWVADIVRALNEIEEETVHPATASRVLKDCFVKGWLPRPRWDTKTAGDSGSSKARLYYDGLTEAGIKRVCDLIIEERQRIPRWVYDPSVVGLSVLGSSAAVSQGGYRTGSSQGSRRSARASKSSRASRPSRRSTVVKRHTGVQSRGPASNEQADSVHVLQEVEISD